MFSLKIVSGSYSNIPAGCSFQSTTARQKKKTDLLSLLFLELFPKPEILSFQKLTEGTVNRGAKTLTNNKKRIFNKQDILLTIFKLIVIGSKGMVLTSFLFFSKCDCYRYFCSFKNLSRKSTYENFSVHPKLLSGEKKNTHTGTEKRIHFTLINQAIWRSFF